MTKHCVNHNSKELKSVAKKLGVNPLVAAARIGLWQNIHGLEKFPTMDELKEPLKRESQILEKVLEPKSKYNFNDFLDESAKPLFNTVNKEATSESNSSKLFKNKRNVSVGEVLDSIQTQFSDLGKHSSELVKRASKLAKIANTNVKFISEDQLVHEDTLMQYEANSNTIQINKNRIDSVDSKEAVVGFLHEVVHSQTVQALSKSPKDRTFAEQELVDVVDKFMKKYEDSDLAKEYGFKDKFEFVAEFYANPEFRDAVKLESDNMWKKLMDAIRRLFDIPMNREYQELFDTIINFVEGTAQDFDGIKRFDRIFEKRVEEDSKYDPLVNTLNNVINKASDNIQNIIKRTESSIKKGDTESKREFLKNITEMSEEFEKNEDAEKWKAVIGYVKSFKRSVHQVRAKLDKLKEGGADFENDDLSDIVQQYQEYLGAYELLPEIQDLISKGSFSKYNLTASEIEDFKELTNIVRSFELEHDLIKNDFLHIKQLQTVKLFSDPSLNTEVETKYRKQLTAEYNKLSVSEKSQISLNEYIHKMLTTRDKDDYEKDLRASALKRIYDPSIDISAASKNLSDNINTNSRIIQIINNLITKTRVKITEAFKDVDVRLSNAYNKFIKEQGNKKPSELYKDLLEQDRNGNYFLRGSISIKFKDKFETELKPILDERKEFTMLKYGEGYTKKQIKSLPESKEYNKQIKAWYKANTRKIKDSNGESKTVPAKKYNLPKLDDSKQSMLDEFKNINYENDEVYKGNNSLVQEFYGALYHKLPSIEKSDLERRIEGDVKGLLKDKVTDLYKVKVDDTEFQTSSKRFDANNKVVRDIKVHYRGPIAPENQSLDLMTIFRKEAFNGINYAEKTAIKSKLDMIVDIVEAKKYKRTDSAGRQLIDKFGKRSPEMEFEGQFSNEYKRIVGLVERTLYDTFSEEAPKLAGADVNKLTSAVNGIAASVSMSFNLASGVSNALNGFTQLFIESFGGDKVNKTDLLKAEAKYLKELPNTLSDLTNPTKKAYFNQLLEMFDVMGGLDLAEQESLRNTFLRKAVSDKMFNVLNESGEHMMHSILTEAILSGIKVMNAQGQYINKDGQITSKEEAASLTDMLYMNKDGILTMSDKVVFSDMNLSTKYNEGGKAHVSLLVKKKVFDLFGVYDIKFKNELSKYWYGKLIMMFKNFFTSALQYRFHGISTSNKAQEDLTDEDKFYNSAEKEYIEGTYTTFTRFMLKGVIPTLKNLNLMYMKDNFNSLSEYEKANLKKATLEFALTSVILPSVGMLLTALGGDDDDNELLWFAIYQNRRLTQELAQFRNPLEAAKMLENPVAGSRFVNNALNFAYDVATPININPQENESYFGYLDQDSKGKNKMVKHGKKLIPIWTQLDKNYKQLHGLQFGK